MNLGTYAIIFQAKIYAILLCATTLKEKNSKNKIIFIVIEHQVALRALRHCKTVSPLILNSICKLNKLDVFSRLAGINIGSRVLIHKRKPGSRYS